MDGSCLLSAGNTELGEFQNIHFPLSSKALGWSHAQGLDLTHLVEPSEPPYLSPPCVACDCAVGQSRARGSHFGNDQGDSKFHATSGTDSTYCTTIVDDDLFVPTHAHAPPINHDESEKTLAISKPQNNKKNNSIYSSS